MNFASIVYYRLLRSIAFRSGYRLVLRDDSRVLDVPDLGVFLQGSALYSDQIAGRNPVDIDFVEQILVLLQTANMLSLRELDQKIPEGHEAKGRLDMWPGEHYRLLAAAVKLYCPKTVIEIGTYTGLSYLALAQRLSVENKIVTFDVVPYNEFANSVLTSDDFIDGKRIQIIGDLSDKIFFGENAALFEECDLLFMDGPKDGRFEYRLWELLRRYLKKDCLVIVDDIRLMNMLNFWRLISVPKLDLISFGHFTGTGILWWKG